ncbi:MAG: hypothetical protein ACTHQQ_05935 [Solirubrobacteraceae bacterium]
MPADAPDDPVEQSFHLQLVSANIRRSLADLRANGERLRQRSRELRDQLRQLLNPPPPH